eukprot:354325-Chlamydomonas_euryale.AAC.3
MAGQKRTPACPCVRIRAKLCPAHVLVPILWAQARTCTQWREIFKSPEHTQARGELLGSLQAGHGPNRTCTGELLTPTNIQAGHSEALHSGEHAARCLHNIPAAHAGPFPAAPG